MSDGHVPNHDIDPKQDTSQAQQSITGPVNFLDCHRDDDEKFILKRCSLQFSFEVNIDCIDVVSRPVHLPDQYDTYGLVLLAAFSFAPPRRRRHTCT